MSGYTAADLSQSERENVDKSLANPLDFPDEFKKWILDWIGQNIPAFGVEQLLGYVQTRAYSAADVVTQEDCSISSYGELATVGPFLDQLNDGSYVVFHGCEIGFTSGVGGAKGWESLSINGGAAADTRANRAFNGSTRRDTTYRADLVRLTAGDGNNTIEMLYRTSQGVPNFSRRWMHAIRVG